MVRPKEVKINVKKRDEEEEGDEPVSPTGQYFNSSVMSVSILAAFETAVPIDDSPTWVTLESLLLPVSPRFSSIMVKDENGTKHWKKVTVNLRDHVYVPIFPPGLNSYDEHLDDYIAKIALEQFPQNKPLWNLHIIKYPTSSASGSLVFKLHHSLGDGFSLMGALFSALKRADDPTLPLTFPTSNSAAAKSDGGVLGAIPRALSVCVNTLKDIGWSLLKSNVLEDDKSAVRSGNPGVEFKPITIGSVFFDLEDIRKIKLKIGGTINDVISGIVFYGTQLYLQSAGQATDEAAKVTALVLLNTRVIESYQPPTEMTKPEAKSPWGNQFGFLHVAIPNYREAEKVDPLQFVEEARRIIQRKRSSLAVYLTGRLLETLRKLIGPEGTAKYLHKTLENTSMTLSNLMGPKEQMQIAGHPIRSFHFMVIGVPQSLTITIVSYMGKLKVTMGVEKGFINPKLLASCMELAFQRIFDAAAVKKPLP